MKKTIIILGIVLTGITLTGCSLFPTTNTNKSKTTTPPGSGIFKTTDFGERWEQKASAISTATNTAASIASIDASFLVFDPNEENTIYLVTKTSGVYKSINASDKWQTTSLTSGSYKGLTIDRLNNKVVYVTQGQKISKSVDGLQTWHDIYLEKRPKQTIVSVINDYFKSSVVYVASTTSIIKSTNYGNDWKLLNWQRPSIYQLYQSRKNQNTLYAWTTGGLYKTTNGAETWEDINAGLTKISGGLKIYSLDFEPSTEQILLTTAAGILFSNDGGVNWKTVPTLFDFKKIAIRTAVFNRQNTSEILFAVDTVLYKTSDNGTTWATLKSVPTTRSITYLSVDPYHPSTVYLGVTSPKK